MTALKTTTRNGYLDSATDGTFSWSHFDGSNGEKLTHLPTGKKIYQMFWLNDKGQMDEPVTGATRDAAVAFWASLSTAEKDTANQGQVEVASTVDSGLCPKCHTYCYGDCEA